MSEGIDPSPKPDEAADRTLRRDHVGRIDQDLPCRGCDYNLRGLLESDDCPECSTPVSRSARPDLLRFSDPAWSRRVARGVAIIIIGLLAGLGVHVLMSGLAVAIPMLGIAVGSWYAVWGPVAAGLSLVTVVGAWLATTPEPGRPEPDGRVTFRRTARWCMMVQVASAPLGMVVGVPGGQLGGGAGVLDVTPMLTTLVIAGMALGLVALVGQAAGLVYLRRLALRIPRPKLARSTMIVMWGYLSSHVGGMAFGVAVIAILPSLAGATTGMPSLLLAVSGAGCAVAIGGIVFAIWALVLLFRYKSAFKLAAQQSRTSWGIGL